MIKRSPANVLIVSILCLQFVFADIILAQQPQSQSQSQFSPQPQSMPGVIYLPPQQQFLYQQNQPSLLPKFDNTDTKRTMTQPEPEKPSDFESFIAENPVVIDEFQFDILKKLDDINFHYSSSAVQLVDSIVVPVRVYKTAKKVDYQMQVDSKVAKNEAPKDTAKLTGFEISKEAVILIDAGYFVGPRDRMFNAFKLVGAKIPSSVSKEIKQFGYDIFNNPTVSLKPDNNVPVGADYIIGPGDEIKVNLWGTVEGEYSIIVDSYGKISLPRIGVIGVAGLSYQELKDMLYREYAKIFTGFKMNVSLGYLRTIKVYVIGNANKPGAYDVSSLSTLLNVLFQASGPSKTGTMRDIQLKRNGKTLLSFDVYDFLIKGNKLNDIRLMNEDVIFIPSTGSLVGIAGNVYNPGIYELKDEKTIAELITLAGGLSDIAFKGSVQIERIIDNSRQTILDSSLDDAKNMKVQAGDVVKIYQVVQDKRTVKILGAVQRGGEYGHKKDMTVRDLIEMSGGLKYYAYTKEAELSRVFASNKGTTNERVIVNVEKALTGDSAHNLKLSENDYIFIKTIPGWELQRKVTISGEVKFPGSYVINKGEKMSSLIDRAGGYTDNAHLRGSVFLRQSVRELQQKSLEEMAMRLEKDLYLGGALGASTALSAEEVQARRVEMEEKQKFVESIRKLKASGRMTIRLSHLRLLKGSEHDIVLEEGDSLYIPNKISVVNVVGAIMSSGSFIYSEKFDYLDYIQLSGGFTRYSDEDNVYVVKADGSARKLSSGFLSWNPFKARWEIEAFGDEIKQIEPGDSIVVPEKLERIAWMRNIKDITQIIMNMAVTAGVFYTIWRK